MPRPFGLLPITASVELLEAVMTLSGEWRCCQNRAKQRRETIFRSKGISAGRERHGGPARPRQQCSNFVVRRLFKIAVITANREERLRCRHADDLFHFIPEFGP